MTIYAIKKNDTILIHTIGEWRRAVIVTYLLQDMGQSIFCTDTDDHVEKLWRAMANGAELIEVEIKETTPLRYVVKPQSEKEQHVGLRIDEHGELT